MTNEFSPNPPLPEPIGAVDQPLSPPAPPAKPAVPLWRWWVSLLIIGSSPLLAALSSTKRAAGEEIMLPKTFLGLFLFSALQLGAFAVVWGIAWAFSRASKDDLLLRWRDGVKPVLWGALYSIGMRFGIMVIAIAVGVIILTILSLFGFKPEDMMNAFKKQQPDIGKMFAPAVTQTDPLYRFFLITVVSFVVAGLREELWRTATILGLQRIAPNSWSQTTKNVLALGASSLLFGLGHWYQGIVGVVVTSFLGLALGGIMLYHRSVWPAIMAHGFFDAATFLTLSLISKN